MNQTTAANTDYAHPQGLALLNHLVATVGPIFTITQASESGTTLGMPPEQVRTLLSRLAGSVWLARIKRGVYAVQTPLLGAELHPFAVAAALMENSAISHWSALAHHGFTTQIPPMVQASTPQKVVTPEMRHGAAYRPRGRAAWRTLDMEFEFIHVKPEHFFGFQLVWVSRWHQVRITDPERTALDLFASSQLFGGTAAAIETLSGFLDRLNLAQLVAYALRYDVGAVIKRLGWALETLGAPREQLEPLRSYLASTTYLAEPSAPGAGVMVSRWRVRDNLSMRSAYGNR